MRILLVHETYVQPGGEDAVLAAERGLLRGKGHDVTEFLEDNRRIEAMPRSALAVGAFWSAASYREISKLLVRDRPEVAHFHNFFPLISPSAYYACGATGTPVVQTLHNFRLVCPGSLLFRDGRPCTDCLGRTLPWPAVVHACYRGSRSETTGVAAMVFLHRVLRTWQRQVDLYIALSEFARGRFIEGGLPGDKIVVKPNFVDPDPGFEISPGGYALYAGRLSEEKGIGTLLKAWHGLRDIPLVIAGDGPLRDPVRAAAESHPEGNIRPVGWSTRAEVFALMKGARMLVFPSGCPEGFGMVIAEAFACGLPVVAARLGASTELVQDLRTGAHFRAGDPEDLADKVKMLWYNPAQTLRMAREARAVFEERYTAERNYPRLMDIYARAAENRRRGA